MTEERKKEMYNLLAYAKSLRMAIIRIYDSDTGNTWRFSSYRDYVRKYNELAISFSKITTPPSGKLLVDVYDIDKIPGMGNTIPIQQKSYFDNMLANIEIMIGFLELHLNIVTDEIIALRDFLKANLRKSIFDLPKNEKDVQDSIEKLLIGKGMTKGVDYDREVGRIKISAKEVIPDFIFSKYNVALEVKIITNKSKVKTVIDEINADIQSYKKQYQKIIFLVYDLGFIRDEIEFKQDLENSSDVFLEVIKH